MAIVVKIDSVDKTDQVDWKTLRYEQNITSQVDTLAFMLRLHAGKVFKPSLSSDIELWDGTTKLFGGKVVQMQEIVDGQLSKIDILCKDHSHEMDGKLEVNVYENTTVSAIITNMVNNTLPVGFSANVTTTKDVKFIAFNYEQPSKCFQQLAELTSSDWFVDEDKVIQFFPKNSINAPFNLDDTSGKYIWNSLVIRSDIKNVRNTIFVRGGVFSGDVFEEIQEADGERETFTFGYRYKNYIWQVDRGSGFSTETIGLDNIDDPTLFDWLYNFQEKAVKLGSATIPSAGHRVRFSGEPQIPVIIRTRDFGSISAYGEYEQKIIDKTIDSKEGARERASAEISAWAKEIDEGSFSTYESGLRVGQSIAVSSVLRGINESYIISKISTICHTPDSFKHTATLVTDRNWGMIEFLQKILMDKDKEIDLDENEVLDKIDTASEDLTFEPETVVVEKDAGTTFVYGKEYLPSGDKRQGAYGGAIYS